jgi:hypothetical protein
MGVRSPLASTATLARDCRLRSIGQHTQRTVHGHAVWEYLHKVGFDEHEVHSSSGTSIVFASHTALQLRETLRRLPDAGLDSVLLCHGYASFGIQWV